jgi:plasmid stability protein
MGRFMKVITVRNLPPRVEKAIRAKAKRERRSLNQTVVSLLEEATAKAKPKDRKPTIHHDLDRLFGVWSREEADEFDASLKESRAVDRKDWE